MPPKKAVAELEIAYTKLLFFFRNKDAEGLKKFLDENPIDLNREIRLRKDAKGTMLHLAVVLESLPIVQLLVERGADIYKRDTFNNRPIDLARKKELYEIASYLESKMPGEEKAAPEEPELELEAHFMALLSAFRRKEIESVQSLLDTHKIDLNYSLKLRGDKAPLLHLAIIGGSLPIVQLLVERGADVCAKDSFGRKPIDLAKGNELYEISSYLEGKMEEAKGFTLRDEFYQWDKTRDTSWRTKCEASIVFSKYNYSLVFFPKFD